ncbi:MAG: hypothetical protein KC502_06200 [Myxococcales bacterium]|nr:hypothetical protein [Myxococcales bacterium]
MTPGSTRLLLAPQWGRVAFAEGAEPSSAAILTTINGVDGADLEGASGLMGRWLSVEESVIATLVSGGPNGDSLELRHQALSGSTLEEVIGAHGPATELQVVALFAAVLAALRRCHDRRLVWGAIHPGGLLVCPPGLEDVPALRVPMAGLALMVAAARGSLGSSGGEGARFALGPAHGVAPEVGAGRLPSASSDVWAVAASMSFALLGTPIFSGETDALVRHHQQQGVPPEAADRLQQLAPQLAPGLLQALSPTPLLRAGALLSLQSACAEILGPEVPMPWQLGSPLISLAAYAGATPFAQRYSVRPPLAVAVTADHFDHADVDRARLGAALRQLDVRRTLSQKSQAKKERTGLKVTVIVLTALIAAAIVWFGTRSRPGVRTTLSPSSRMLQRKRPPPPKPVRSLPLFRKGDGPSEQ